MTEPERPVRDLTSLSEASARVLSVEGRGPLRLAVKTVLLAGDDGVARGVLAPVESRDELIRVERPSFETVVESRTSSPHLPGGVRGKAVETQLSDDGFGLNAAARREALLFTLTVPRDLYGRLAAGDEERRTFDFFLVRTDPAADRAAVPFAGGEPPPGAEWRVRGSTHLKPREREPFPVDSRRRDAAGPEGSLAVPSLRVEVTSRLTIERLFPGPGTAGSMTRADDLTWAVLDRAEEPWLLSVEGTVRTAAGPEGQERVQDGFFSRKLVLLEVGDLDASIPPP